MQSLHTPFTTSTLVFIQALNITNLFTGGIYE